VVEDAVSFVTRHRKDLESYIEAPSATAVLVLLVNSWPSSTTGYALYYVVIGLCSLAANSTFGFLWTAINSFTAFEFSLLIAIVGSFALVAFMVVSRLNGS
jgi:hypothetical protein